MAEKSNFIVDQGTSFLSMFQLTDDDGAPQNLTGYTITSEFKKTPAANTVYSFVATVEQPSNGVFSLAMSANATSNVVPGRYFYDVKSVDSDGNVLRLLEGIVTITPEITT